MNFLRRNLSIGWNVRIFCWSIIAERYSHLGSFFFEIVFQSSVEAACLVGLNDKDKMVVGGESEVSFGGWSRQGSICILGEYQGECNLRQCHFIFDHDFGQNAIVRWENVIQLSTINLHLGFHSIGARREIVRDIDLNRDVFSGELIVIYNVLQHLRQNCLSRFIDKRNNERTHAIVALQGADGAEERLCRSYAQRFFAPKFTVPSVARTIVEFIFHIAFIGCDFKF